ncbi:MAG TPA: hypothetical protein DEQ39_18465 [Atlantibacter hermannii]|nr:hypothetical protein [Enterobacteriaceae bacterium]HAP81593.1 hypothetical protein [Enterobacteriaceae bacterium]HCC12845.1 hypothetical protein [Atlantibacter hermannii]
MFDEWVFHFHDLHTLSPQKGGSHKKNRRIIPLFRRCAISNGHDQDQPNWNQSILADFKGTKQGARKRLPALLELPRFLTTATAWGLCSDR